MTRPEGRGRLLRTGAFVLGLLYWYWLTAWVPTALFFAGFIVLALIGGRINPPRVAASVPIACGLVSGAAMWVLFVDMQDLVLVTASGSLLVATIAFMVSRAARPVPS